ncbi:AAA family ATPase [Aquisphaera insulae]|uniref:AAA family ATPase n=1 Tax=Aquisphaera insulae TaxID=2712864 RepID=UPI0013EC8D30|nr:AAA family ATPase [Aquisphaera insulae]
MNFFKSLKVVGFRRLHSCPIGLRRLNVVIGANGCGKTSLLDVFTLLASSAGGQLARSMSDMGGLDANLSNLLAVPEGKSQEMAFDLEMEIPDHNPLIYRLNLAPIGVGYEITDEMLEQDQGKASPFKHIDAHRGRVRYFNPQPGKQGLVKPTWDYNEKETALSQVPRMFRESEDFRMRLASSTHYHVLDVGRRAPVRLPQQMKDARLPGHDGEDLVSCLFTLRETDPDRFSAIEASLQAGFPGFERLNFPPVATGILAMTWKEKSSKTPFAMHQLSEGTLRFLWLTTLLHSPALPAVTMIDEPEVSLHPELLSLLADLLREAAQRTQIIVATHADRLVRFLTPPEVLVVNLGEKGEASFQWADELDIDAWLDEYTLDEAWRMGRIGARP